MSERHKESGTVVLVSPIKEVGQKALKKRTVVVEIADGKYPQLVEFEATGDRTSDLDAVRVGDEITVHFNVRGRKWDGPNGTKYFVSLDVWRIDTASKATRPAAASDDPLSF